MVTKLFKSKLKLLKESSYMGQNSTSKRAEIPAPYEDIYETLHVRENGDDRSHYSTAATIGDDEKVSDVNAAEKKFKLSRQYSIRDYHFPEVISANGITAESLSEIDTESNNTVSRPQSTKFGSSDSLESLFKPKNNVNRLLTSCAMSNTRNALTVSGVAAAFYNGGWLPSAPAADKVSSLNEFIADVRGDVESGLPGRSLTVVLGNYISALDSVVSTIAYAFLLHTKRESEDDCIVPVINMKRADLQIHTELAWLFNITQLDVESLIFSDEISLTYYHRFGNLRLVLVGHSKLEPGYEGLQDVVIETLESNMMNGFKADIVKVVKCGSCCTLVSEKFASEAPKLLLGRGLSRLLLAGILLETSNLDLSIGQCSSRDVAMATLLLNGAGRYGRNGFFKMIRKKVCDLSILSPKEILNKDIRVWTSTVGNIGKPARIGMCSMGISLGRFLTVETGVSDEFLDLQRSKKLDILLVHTSYYDKYDKFKRELLLSTDSVELVQRLVQVYNSQSLQLHPMDIIGLGPCTKAYNQGNIAISGAQLHQLTNELLRKMLI